MSNLVMHARRELTLLGEDKDTADGIVRMVAAFADMGHSGGSAAVTIPMVSALLRFENLTPLTNDPEEWMAVGRDTWGDDDMVWQSRRNPGAFSHDGGKSYYLLDEGAHAKNRRPLHTSRDHTIPRDGEPVPEIEEIVAVQTIEPYFELLDWARKMSQTLDQHRMADRPEDTLMRAYALNEDFKKMEERDDAEPA